MAELVDIFVPLDDEDAPLGPVVERALGWARGAAGDVTVLRRSLDARKGRPLGYRLRVRATRAGEREEPAPLAPRRTWPAGKPPPRVVVVGSGPAGTWAALRLAEGGIAATILEQG